MHYFSGAAHASPLPCACGHASVGRVEAAVGVRCTTLGLTLVVHHGIEHRLNLVGAVHGGCKGLPGRGSEWGRKQCENTVLAAPEGRRRPPNRRMPAEAPRRRRMRRTRVHAERVAALLGVKVEGVGQVGGVEGGEELVLGLGCRAGAIGQHFGAEVEGTWRAGARTGALFQTVLTQAQSHTSGAGAQCIAARSEILRRRAPLSISHLPQGCERSPAVAPTYSK